MPQKLDVHADAIETLPPADFRWPGGKRLGIFFRVALEGWSDDQWPGFGPMGNPLKPGTPDLNALGWVEYGARRGIHRILDVLERQQIQTSMLVCGVLAERYPQALRRIADAGHEIVAHSYGMDVIPAYLDEAAERDNIRRTTDLLEKACGVRPVGWISPREHMFSPRPWCCGQLYTLCTEARLPLFVEYGQLTLDEVHEIMTAHPQLRLVLLRVPRLGRHRTLYALLERHPGVRLCLSSAYSVHEGIADLVGKFGAGAFPGE